MRKNKCIQCGGWFLSVTKRKYCSAACANIFVGKWDVSERTSSKKYLKTPSGLEVLDNCFGKVMAGKWEE